MRLMRRLGDVGRYAVGTAVAFLLYPVEGLVVYVGLLGLAMVTGSGLGGPLAGPAIVLAAAVAGAVVTAVVLLPAVVLGELLTRRRRRAVASLVAAALSISLWTTGVWVWGAVDGWRALDTAALWAAVGAFSALPLMAMIGVVHGAGLLLAVFDRRRGAAIRPHDSRDEASA